VQAVQGASIQDRKYFKTGADISERRQFKRRHLKSAGISERRQIRGTEQIKRRRQFRLGHQELNLRRASQAQTSPGTRLPTPRHQKRSRRRHLKEGAVNQAQADLTEAQEKHFRPGQFFKEQQPVRL
jgi:hypothetical protein